MNIMIKNPKDISFTNRNFKFYTPIAMFFITFLIVANIVVQKLVPIGNYFMLTVGDFIFPFIYIADGILTEVYGYGASRRVIWMALTCNVLVAIIISIAVAVPSAKEWVYQDQFAIVLDRTKQIIFASFVAFLCGEFLNSYILAKLKVAMTGKKLWFRSVLALSIGQGIDTIIFNIIAFWGVLSLHAIFVLTLSVYLFKILYEVVLMPVIYLFVGFLKKREGVDIYDKNTNFNPFSMNLF